MHFALRLLIKLHDAQEGLSPGQHPVKEQLQLVIAAVHPAIGQQADQVQRPASGCRRNVLPAIQLKELATLQRVVHQPGPLVHLLQNHGLFTTRKVAWQEIYDFYSF